ncbi:MAG TPA: hypothetical protein PK874_01915 [Desulfobacteraceae bacterium]|nr:hypothetical protein [Desulfobacteraceae bacterium]HPJ68272.1 hypothetical protein [Desulfobacteraceae bacterium]HPQ27935.1 hypothetical protein [Desulfobacteraceae bacterium]
MSTRSSIFSLLLISILLTLSTSACGRWMIKGQVVDAETNNPIENAAVQISWWESDSGPIGLAGSFQVEVAEDLSDEKGLFEVPKYSTLFKWYHMAVYKKGYVCWSSDDIFPTYEKRKDFSLENGMVIKLERFKDEYDKEKHANFTTISAIGRKAPGLFDEAIQSERELLYEKAQKRRKDRRRK